MISQLYVESWDIPLKPCKCTGSNESLSKLFSFQKASEGNFSFKKNSLILKYTFSLFAMYVQPIVGCCDVFISN